MIKKYLLPGFFLIIMLIVFELIAKFGFVNINLFPPPSSVFRVLLENQNQLFQSFLSSFTNILLGLVISLIFGFFLGLIFYLFPTLKISVYPFAIFFQTVPIIAIAPLLIIYFGYGQPTIIASAVIVTFFPIFVSTLIGLESVPEEYLLLFKINKSRRIAEFIYLRIPFAYPFLYSSLKTAVGLSVVGVVIGEFITGGGVGGIIDAARTQQRVDIIFAGLFLLMVTGIFLLLLLELTHFVARKHSPMIKVRREQR